jgi:hypothetical protein
MMMNYFVGYMSPGFPARMRPLSTFIHIRIWPNGETQERGSVKKKGRKTIYEEGEDGGGGREKIN